MRPRAGDMRVFAILVCVSGNELDAMTRLRLQAVHCFTTESSDHRRKPLHYLPSLSASLTPHASQRLNSRYIRLSTSTFWRSRAAG